MLCWFSAHRPIDNDSDDMNFTSPSDSKLINNFIIVDREFCGLKSNKHLKIKSRVLSQG